MIDAQYRVNADDVSRCFRILRKVEPDLIDEFKSGMRTKLDPAAKAIAEKYPNSPYLSGLAYSKDSSWNWSDVVGKVSVTPGKSRSGVGAYNLVALRMTYKGAIPWVTDFARADSPELSPQGKALVRNIERRFPGWPNGGRIFFKAFMQKRGEVFSQAEFIMFNFITKINGII